MNTLYIFIDESGNFDFSENGSSHFILTAMSTRNPIASARSIFEAKYELLKNGVNAECFHASENRREVRDAFYSKIGHTVECDIDCVVADKRKAHPALYMKSSRSERVKTEEKFFELICKQLVRYVAHRHVRLSGNNPVSRIVVVLDKTIARRKRELFAERIKAYVKNESSVTPYVYFHTTRSDANSQLSDYCCWAIKRKWVDGESSPYEKIKSLVRSEFDIFMFGDWYYY